MRRNTLSMLAVFAAAGGGLIAAGAATAETVKVQLRGFEEVPSVSTAASGDLRL